MENLTGIKTKHLLKIYFSKKEAFYICDGILKSTNKDLEFENIKNLEYVFYSSDFETMFYIKQVLQNRLKRLFKSWSKFCYNYLDFNSFLNSYGLSLFNFNRLKRLKNEI